jgi:hypothetical protein
VRTAARSFPTQEQRARAVQVVAQAFEDLLTVGQGGWAEGQAGVLLGGEIQMPGKGEQTAQLRAAGCIRQRRCLSCPCLYRAFLLASHPAGKA